MVKHNILTLTVVGAMALIAGAAPISGAFATSGAGEYDPCTNMTSDRDPDCFVRDVDGLKAGLALSQIETIHVSGQIVVDEDLTIDLSGKTIEAYGGADVFYVQDGAKLTINGDGTVV